MNSDAEAAGTTYSPPKGRRLLIDLSPEITIARASVDVNVTTSRRLWGTWWGKTLDLVVSGNQRSVDRLQPSRSLDQSIGHTISYALQDRGPSTLQPLGETSVYPRMLLATQNRASSYTV